MAPGEKNVYAQKFPEASGGRVARNFRYEQ
jgi:hypothetical protein